MKTSALVHLTVFAHARHYDVKEKKNLMSKKADVKNLLKIF